MEMEVIISVWCFRTRWSCLLPKVWGREVIKTPCHSLCGAGCTPSSTCLWRHWRIRGWMGTYQITPAWCIVGQMACVAGHNYQVRWHVSQAIIIRSDVVDLSTTLIQLSLKRTAGLDELLLACFLLLQLAYLLLTAYFLLLLLAYCLLLVAAACFFLVAAVCLLLTSCCYCLLTASCCCCLLTAYFLLLLLAYCLHAYFLFLLLAYCLLLLAACLLLTSCCCCLLTAYFLLLLAEGSRNRGKTPLWQAMQQ